MRTHKQDKKRTPATKITYQGFSHGFKLGIINEVENGLVSVNQASIKYGIARSTIQRWMKKMGNFDKRLKASDLKSLKSTVTLKTLMEIIGMENFS